MRLGVRLMAKGCNWEVLALESSSEHEEDLRCEKMRLFIPVVRSELRMQLAADAPTGPVEPGSEFPYRSPHPHSIDTISGSDSKSNSNPLGGFLDADSKIPPSPLSFGFKRAFVFGLPRQSSDPRSCPVLA
jgi:hypothetical protein